MEFKHDNSVIALYLTGKNVNKSFVSRTIAHYRNTGSVVSRPKRERKINDKNTRYDSKSEDQICWKSMPQ